MAEIRLESCTVDLIRNTVERPDGTTATLTAKEGELLSFLVRHEGTAVSRDELLEEVWGAEGPMQTRTVDTTIRRLRAKLEEQVSDPRWLVTRYGRGYALEAAEDAESLGQDGLFGAQRGLQHAEGGVLGQPGVRGRGLLLHGQEDLLHRGRLCQSGGQPESVPAGAEDEEAEALPALLLQPEHHLLVHVSERLEGPGGELSAGLDGEGEGGLHSQRLEQLPLVLFEGDHGQLPVLRHAGAH